MANNMLPSPPTVSHLPDTPSTNPPGYPALALSCEAKADAPIQIRQQIEAMRQTLGSCLTDDVLLVASELASNAVLHAASPFTFQLRLTAWGVLILIEDQSLQLPKIPSLTDPLRRGGRGLLLVSRLSSQYGYSTSSKQGLKLVWAIIPWTNQ